MNLTELPADWPGYFESRTLHTCDPLLQQFYRTGTFNPQAPIANLPMIALDFETTGLDPDNAEIVSIGLVPFDLRRIYCASARHWLIKPTNALTESSVVIHSITHSELAAAPRLAEVLPLLLSALAGRLVVVHYRLIEREFLNRASLKLTGESLLFPMLDTLALESRIQHQQQTRWQRLLKRPIPSVRLGQSRQRYNLPHYDAHNALTDALASAELLQAQIAHYFNADTPVSTLWC